MADFHFLREEVCQQGDYSDTTTLLQDAKIQMKPDEIPSKDALDQSANTANFKTRQIA